VCLIVGDPFASFVEEHHPRRSRRITPEEAVEILRAVFEHRPQPGSGLIDQSFKGSLAGSLDGGENSTPSCQDFQVAFAFQPPLELGGAIANPDGMCVRVNKPRHHHPPACVQGFFTRIISLQLSSRSDRRDLSISDKQSAIRDQTQATQICAALGSTCQRNKLNG
jgi:hypothetical protein